MYDINLFKIILKLIIYFKINIKNLNHYYVIMSESSCYIKWSYYAVVRLLVTDINAPWWMDHKFIIIMSYSFKSLSSHVPRGFFLP